jgi:hypothetical protein
MGLRALSIKRALAALLLTVGFIAPYVMRAQSLRDELPQEINIKRNSGQSIQPVFEGWQQYPDGHISLWFGYFNRNYEEQPDIPLGPLNNVNFTPDGDSGQPTHFYARRQTFLFKVDVPANFDRTKKVVWTLTANGQKLSASGWLQSEWEIDNGVRMENAGGAPDMENQPPEISGSGPQTGVVGKAIELAATAKDDGLPKPTPQLPTSKLTAGAVTTAGGGRKARGVTIKWIVVRNPAAGGEASFSPEDSGSPVYGKSVTSKTSVTFSAPGKYWLRAIASDTTLETFRDFQISVGK